MFSSRKLLEPPSKRSNGLVSLDATGALPDLAAYKRQRLDLWGDSIATNGTNPVPRRGTPTLDDVDSDSVLVKTADCTVSRTRSVPVAIANEIRRERPSPRQVTTCRVAVPTLNGHRGERHVLSYVVLSLRNRLVLWQDSAHSNSIVTLPIPDEIESTDTLYPFLFAIYGARVSLMVVSASGRVLFWEDIDLPYESIPLSVQIPLQHRERVATNAHASITVVPAASALAELELVQLDRADQELKSILCWSNLGNVWEIAMEDRRIRVRSLDRQNKGFLSGLSKTVSQFFFASSTATSQPSDEALQSPIKAIRVAPTSSLDEDRSIAKLVLFDNGILELRSFNAVDTSDCSADIVWRTDANRLAITYFSEQFPAFHLAKVFMVSLPYVTSPSTFGMVVAFVCTAHNEDTPKVKYALFHFEPKSSRRNVEPAPAWACVLDYEPTFSEAVDLNEFLDIDTVAISTTAFYLVWVASQPTHFASIKLPVPGQESVKSSAFSLQGVERNAALGFSPRVEVSAESSDALKGSVSFLLMDFDSQSPSGSGLVCSATASNMASIVKPSADALQTHQRNQRVEDADNLTAELFTLDENLSVEAYAALLSTHFQSFQQNNRSTPLRISTKDVPRVAQAAVGVALQILDAKASSGLRWGKEANESATSKTQLTMNGTIVTPKLVRFQLEEKRARFEKLLEFVQQNCIDVWRFIEESEDVMQYLVDGEEQLHAAVTLCKFQGSLASIADDGEDAGVKPKLSGQVLLRAIQRAVHQRGYDNEQLRIAGYNAFDIFFCEITKVHEIFVALSVEIQSQAADSGEGSTEFLYSLLESGYSMQSLLKTPTSTRLQSSGKWMFTRHIREAIADQISRLSAAVGYTGKPIVSTPEEVFEVGEQIHKLGGLLLSAYQRFLPLTVGTAADDLAKEIEITKRLTINPLVFIANDYEAPTELAPTAEVSGAAWSDRKKKEIFVAAVKLAEEHVYYEAMVHLVYREDEANLAQLDYILGRLEKSAAAKRLDAYCKKLPDFAEFVFRWFGGDALRYPWPFDGECARAQVFSYLLANSSAYGSSLEKYLKSNPLLIKHAWVTAVESEKYGVVAKLTLNEATREQASLAKRKTMASIAKIAARAGPSTPVSTAVHIKRELSIGRIQEVLMELPVKINVGSHPLSAPELVEKALEAMQAVVPEDPLRASVFLVAVEALECLPFETISEADFTTYCIRTWRECIAVDEELWLQLLEEHASGVNEHKVESLMRCTLLFKAMARYPSRPRSEPSAALTVALIDDMVAREASHQSVISPRTRQLFIKALNLALAP